MIFQNTLVFFVILVSLIVSVISYIYFIEVKAFLNELLNASLCTQTMFLVTLMLAIFILFWITFQSSVTYSNLIFSLYEIKLKFLSIPLPIFKLTRVRLMFSEFTKLFSTRKSQTIEFLREVRRDPRVWVTQFLITQTKLLRLRVNRFHALWERSWLELLRLFWTFLTGQLKSFYQFLLVIIRMGFGEGAICLQGLVLSGFIDALVTDDEPLWEPVEWSLVQFWIMFVFMFAWIAENLITSRYGSYTGRDKRVWLSWYKTLWLIECWYLFSIFLAAVFVITPFYGETNYTFSLVVSWWNWYNRIFFFKFISLYSIVLYLAYYLQSGLGQFHWSKSFFIVIVINILLIYLLYIQFLLSFFAYFSDPNWYHQTRLVDYIQLSHEPNKWSWGNPKRDHFSYHKSSTVFWFKNDGPFAAAFMIFNVIFFMILLTVYIFWFTLFRRIYTTQEITYTYTTYCVSALRQFFYIFLFLYLFVIFSFIIQYLRLPIEYEFITNTQPLIYTILEDLRDLPGFLVEVFIFWL